MQDDVTVAPVEDYIAVLRDRHPEYDDQDVVEIATLERLLNYWRKRLDRNPGDERAAKLYLDCQSNLNRRRDAVKESKAPVIAPIRRE